MHNNHRILKTIVVAFSVALLSAGMLRADVIQTKNGSRLTGKVTQIGSDTVVLGTDFAGDIKVKQSEIVSIATDGPINLRLADGKVLNGMIASAPANAPAGSVAVSGPSGNTVANLAQIKQSWAPDALDPEIAKLQHHWSYEAGMDITGKTGNHEQVGTSFSFRATLQSSYDKLQLYTTYDRQVTDKEKSSDQGRIGADYQDNFYGRLSWYARDELGFDHVKQIKLYNTAAGGLGYDVLKSDIDTLTFRAGLAHRYEQYSADGAENLSKLALDFGLINTLTMKTWSMHNLITYTPAIDDFANYRLYHESYIELPLANPNWKFRVGISNDYHSPLPLGSTERLDTTYFARLILNWK